MISLQQLQPIEKVYSILVLDTPLVARGSLRTAARNGLINTRWWRDLLDPWRGIAAADSLDARTLCTSSGRSVRYVVSDATDVEARLEDDE